MFVAKSSWYFLINFVIAFCIEQLFFTETVVFIPKTIMPLSFVFSLYYLIRLEVHILYFKIYIYI